MEEEGRREERREEGRVTAEREREKMKNGKCGAKKKEKGKKDFRFLTCFAPSSPPPLGQTPLHQSN